MRRLGYTAIILALMLAGAADGQDIQALIDECEACHGPRGVSTEDDIPSLAGRDPDKLVDALEQFYYYERHCPTTSYRYGDRPKTPMNMCNVANTLSAEDQRAIASHFASQ